MPDEEGRTVPKGKPLDLTDAELDRLAEVTDEDIERTFEKWQKYAPRWARNILVAEPYD